MAGVKIVSNDHAKGFGVGKGDHSVVFVVDGVEGDVVDVEITRVRKKCFEGRVERLIRPSPNRVEPRCPHFSICGGCTWQHMAYEAQLAVIMPTPMWLCSLCCCV